jgi:hypothetical protein
MFMENFDGCFIEFLLFIKNNSKIITHKEKHSKNIYIVVFYFLFFVIVVVYKTCVGCYTIWGIYFYRLFTHWRADKFKFLFLYSVVIMGFSLVLAQLVLNWNKLVPCHLYRSWSSAFPSFTPLSVRILRNLIFSSWTATTVIFVLCSEGKPLHRNSLYWNGVRLSRLRILL